MCQKNTHYKCIASVWFLPLSHVECQFNCEEVNAESVQGRTPLTTLSSFFFVCLCRSYDPKCNVLLNGLGCPFDDYDADADADAADDDDDDRNSNNDRDDAFRFLAVYLSIYLSVVFYLSCRRVVISHGHLSFSLGLPGFFVDATALVLSNGFLRPTAAVAPNSINNITSSRVSLQQNLRYVPLVFNAITQENSDDYVGISLAHSLSFLYLLMFFWLHCSQRRPSLPPSVSSFASAISMFPPSRPSESHRMPQLAT